LEHFLIIPVSTFSEKSHTIVLVVFVVQPFAIGFPLYISCLRYITCCF